MIDWSKLHFSNTYLQSSIKCQLLLLCFALLGSLKCSSGEWIDEKHLKEYPYCGSMNYHKHDHQSSASRMVNADESKAHYRWLAVIQLDTWEKGTTLRKKKTTSYCTGAIITDRHVLTKGSCLCLPEGEEKQLKYYNCLRSDGKLVNQIRAKENEVNIYVGRYSNDPDESGQLDWIHWKASGAYTMPLWKNLRFDREDIGITLIPSKTSPDDRFFNKKELLNTKSLRNAGVVPICLGRQGIDINGKTLKGAGYGQQYQEVPNVKPRDPLYSSCMSSELSFRESRFRNCDMTNIKANNYECRTEFPPTEMEECKKYFTEAHTSMKTYLEKLTNSEKDAIVPLENIIFYIRKKSPSRFENDQIVCMGTGEDGWWQKSLPYGWCLLPQLPNEKQQKWGACSSSCSKDLMKTNSITPRWRTHGIFGSLPREFEWTYDKEQQKKCQRMLKTSGGSYNIPFIEEDTFKLCMNMKLPKTQVVRFERKKILGLFSVIDWNKPIFEKEDPPKDMFGVYSSPCYGDSGSPQMIYVENDYTEPKFFVAAIAKGQWGKIYDFRSEKYIPIPCGGNIINRHKYSQREEYIVKSIGTSHSTTHLKIFKWIEYVRTWL